MADLRYVIVAYDISDDKKRTLVFKTLLYYGLIHAQYSVFKGFIDARELERLIETLKGVDLGPNDTIEIVRVGRGREACVVIGKDIEFKGHIII